MMDILLQYITTANEKRIASIKIEQHTPTIFVHLCALFRLKYIYEITLLILIIILAISIQDDLKMAKKVHLRKLKEKKYIY